MSDRNEIQKHHPIVHFNHSTTTCTDICALNISYTMYTVIYEIAKYGRLMLLCQSRQNINVG